MPHFMIRGDRDREFFIYIPFPSAVCEIMFCANSGWFESCYFSNNDTATVNILSLIIIRKFIVFVYILP